MLFVTEDQCWYLQIYKLNQQHSDTNCVTWGHTMYSIQYLASIEYMAEWTEYDNTTYNIKYTAEWTEYDNTTYNIKCMAEWTEYDNTTYNIKCMAEWTEYAM